MLVRYLFFMIVFSSTISFSTEIIRAAPTAPVRNIAEWEQNRGVLIRYPLGIPLSLVKAMAEYDTVFCLAESYDQSSAENSFNSAGVDMDHVVFVNAKTDSYWSRDYGPWFIFDGNDDIGIVNFTYNRPQRPNDTKVPGVVADFFNIPVYDMNVVHTGGNYMTTGLGISASSDLVYKESAEKGISQSLVDQRMEDYLGITNYVVVDDPNGTYIDHIDCWGKFLAPDKVLIRSVPQNHPQYSKIEQTADYFANLDSPYGTKFRVYRVMSYDGEDLPYTNSYIMNGRVYVPQTGSKYDSDALDLYREAMPGYDVLGFVNSSNPWLGTDALHCRTHEIPDFGMLYIGTVPLHDTLKVKEPTITVKAQIKNYSGEDLIDDSLQVYYKYDNAKSYSSVKLDKFSSDSFCAEIPKPRKFTKISYYFHAADKSKRSSSMPYIGAPDPFVFYIDYTVGIKGGSVVTFPENSTANFNTLSNSITVRYSFAKINGSAVCKVYDISGRNITTRQLSSATGSLSINASDLSNGFYIVKLINGTNIENMKVNVIK